MQRPRLSDAIVETVLGRIGTGELREGDPLPSETTLAASHGVSRSVAREAIRGLAAKGFVRVTQGSTTTVAPRHHWQVLDPEFLAVNSGAGFFSELTEAREILEPMIARLAAERATPELIATMTELTEQLAAAGDDPDRHADLDVAFHSAIAEAAANAVLTSIHNSISNMARRTRQISADVPGAVSRAIEWHRHILEAIRRHDGPAAEAAMRMHLVQVRGELNALPDSDPGNPPES